MGAVDAVEASIAVLFPALGAAAVDVRAEEAVGVDEGVGGGD